MRLLHGPARATGCTLLILPLRLVADIAYDAYTGKGTGERRLMNKMIERIPYDHLLHLVDAGLYSFELLLSLQKKNRSPLVGQAQRLCETQAVFQ
jgi:hypothetical protein